MPTHAKPAALKLLDGTGPGRDKSGHLVPLGPEFPRVAPDPPDWLVGDALDEWNRIVPALARLDLLKQIDFASLTTYCCTWARFVSATKSIEEDGYTITGSHGGVIRNPVVGVAVEASRELRQWCQEFGLSPAAEGKLVAPKTPGRGDDGFDDD